MCLPTPRGAASFSSNPFCPPRKRRACNRPSCGQHGIPKARLTRNSLPRTKPSKRSAHEHPGIRHARARLHAYPLWTAYHIRTLKPAAAESRKTQKRTVHGYMHAGVALQPPPSWTSLQQIFTGVLLQARQKSSFAFRGFFLCSGNRAPERERERELRTNTQESDTSSSVSGSYSTKIIIIILVLLCVL